jgi:hypothetical protein
MERCNIQWILFYWLLRMVEWLYHLDLYLYIILMLRLSNDPHSLLFGTQQILIALDFPNRLSVILVDGECVWILM